MLLSRTPSLRRRGVVGPGEARPVGLDGADLHAACRQREARREGVGHAIEAQHGEAAPARRRSHGADGALARRHRRPGLGRERLEGDRHYAVARGAAMLHARYDFLAHIAALLEVDAAELVHVGLVREGLAVNEIKAAAWDSKRDTVRLVGARVDERGAELGG